MKCFKNVTWLRSNFSFNTTYTLNTLGECNDLLKNNDSKFNFIILNNNIQNIRNNFFVNLDR